MTKTPLAPHAAPSVPVRPGRPRSAAADLAIRDATLHLLGEHGYANLTMCGVATVAGVSTATLYRRWRSKVDLVVDVLRSRAEEQPVPDTGSLRGDCRAIVRGYVDSIAGSPSGSIMPALVGEIGRNAELAEALRTNLIAPRRAALVEMLKRATARGEVRRGIDLEVVVDLLFGSVLHRLLVTGAPLDRKVAHEVADLVVEAIATPGRKKP